ncbi:hypothetical protein [Leucobacter tenebrionis]|uniref:hypothetical protein n=1 Tax=Leucobacter tenebrionis TaxID=2873270 RepID=UPI001CA7A061|nr:hypothetical protein [Leucobacter tenebrionis]QZY52905.1 hypothetical protein KVY00_05580 [Leucobacter tenebrionis]
MKRHAFPATCPRCSAPVIEAEYDLAAAVGVPLMRADPTHISPGVESSCVILDRPVYNLHTRQRTPRLSLRDHYWHRYHYCGPPDQILPAHQCNVRLPGTPITIPDPDDTAPEAPSPDTTPF